MGASDGIDLEALDFGAVEPEEFARIVKGLSTRRIAEFMAGPQRRRVLDEVFERMQTRFRPGAAGDRDALVRWRIADDPARASAADGASGGEPGGGDPGAGTGEGADVYETHIAGGTCTVTPGRSDRTPQLSLTMAAPDFLRLASGNASGPTLFFTRKLKVRGDIRLAGSLTYFFDIPRA